MLTREEVERRLVDHERRCQKFTTPDTHAIKQALQTALAAMDERDEAIQRGVSSAVALGKCQGERDALAAEGLLLREALEAYVFHCEIDGQRKSYCEGDYWCSRCSDGDACAVLTIPSLISAEVERVRRLEALERGEAVLSDAEIETAARELRMDASVLTSRLRGETREAQE